MPPKKEKLSIVCAECGKEFYKLQCQLGRGRGKYCSKDCLGKSKRHGSELYCAWCDKPFYRRFGEQDNKTINQFCCKPCYSEWREENRNGFTYPKIGDQHRHRVVAEAILKRKLLPEEVVHHIDKNRLNYNPDNLAVFPNQSTHFKCHQGKLSNEDLRRFSIGKDRI